MTPIGIRVSLLAGALLIAPSWAGAQSLAPADRARKEMHAHRVPVEASPPRIDGHLDDESWSRVQFSSDFIAKQPIEGAAPQARTDIAFVYDDEALFVAARMLSRDPGDVRPSMGRRDQFGRSEVLIVALDTYLDRRTAYTFAVTAAGVRLDYFQPRDGELSRDYSYNPVWEARTRVDSTGWTAEMRIPFSQLRFSRRDVQVWGLNINRYVPSRNDDIFWVMIPRDETGWSSRFGNLMGIEGIRPSRRLELFPYVAGDATFGSDTDARDPFRDGSEVARRVGADVKVGLGPNLTLDATVNPDFGQVEADPAEVNLSAFETFFSERRPFFSEGNDLFQGGGQGYFYSRRVGAPPHGDASGDFVDRPDNSTILGAAKLSGRLAPDLSIGAFGAVTGRESARTFDSTTSRFEKVRVEPVTGYGVVRVVKQFGSSGSTAGAILTGVCRDVAVGDPLAAELNRQAYSGGTDWTVRFSGGQYEIRANAGFSYIEGDPASIARIQNSSAHYFQRPDADYVRLDSSRTSLLGYNATWRVGKRSGRHWLWNVWGEIETPSFELNDIGRLMSADDIDVFANLRYRENEPGSIFYRYVVGLSTRAGWNFGWVRQSARAELWTRLTWLNLWSTGLSLAVNGRSLSDKLTRGGPLMTTPLRWLVRGDASSHFSFTNSWRIGAGYENDDLGGWRYDVSARFGMRPRGAWTFSVRPRYEREINTRQYLDQLDGGRAATSGRRYVFSMLDRRTLSAQLRLSYAFNPDLILELYAEPFTSSGSYTGFGELAAAKTNELRTYGTDGTTIARTTDGSVVVTDGPETVTLDNPEFNVRSFRSNLVLRWEWRAGSTLFLVWQQNRSARDERGVPVRGTDLWDSFADSGDQFLALKINYWLPFR